MKYVQLVSKQWERKYMQYRGDSNLGEHVGSGAIVINSALTLLVFQSQVRIINNQSINVQQNKVHKQSGL